MALFYLRTNVYRINQAATFNKMSELSRYWKPGNWSMFMDADQFYSDDTIKTFNRVCSDPKDETDLIVAKERTFFENFTMQTTEYEKRDFNNMPHRIKENMFVVPTRDIILEQYPKPKVYGKDPKAKRLDAGYYFHYKFRPLDKERESAGYNLGDRKRPGYSHYNFSPYKGTHPSVIEEMISRNKLSN